MNRSENKIYQVDAFTDAPFKGNPAAVMIVNTMPSESFMQNMAMEMNLSETAFVVPQKDSFRIRYFTPKAEIPVAGHPTLASAHILYELGIVNTGQEITFEANVATLKVKKEKDLIVMNFPAFPLEPIQVPVEFNRVIGFDPIRLFQSSQKWKLAIAGTEEEVFNARPIFSEMGQHQLGHLIITAKSTSGQEDFVARCFAPDLGVNEDPVTGSAHCALTPFWAKELNLPEMKSKQVSDRTGELFVKMIGDRVEIAGKAVTVFEADLSIGSPENS